MTKWRVILEPDLETGEWAIWCPELPGCKSSYSIDTTIRIWAIPEN